nr:discoidin domain-containing protein [Clostridium perfringens]
MNPPSGNDGPASYAIDGNESTLWHTNYRGGDTHSGNHWLSVDFGEELDFDTVNVLSRGKEINGSIKGYKLEANINGEWTVVKEGEFTDGVEEKIELDEAIKASGIKLTALSTFNEQNFAAVREISVTKKDREATEDEINELKALVKEINKEDYTKATAYRYINLSQKVNALDKINLSQLDRLRSDLNKAYEGLVEARELNKTLVEANKLIKEDYTIESWTVFEEALNNAKDLNNDIEATKEGVDEATSRLKEAMNSLEKVNNEGEIVTGHVNNFEASEVAKKNVTVTWSAPESTKGLEGYVLYRDGKKVAEIGAEETSYKFKGLNRHTIYNFKIAAKYSNGELSKKESITLRTAR